MKRLGLPWEPTVGELAASIFCREFVPMYEPVVHLTTGAMLGWAVHGTWIHPTRGLLTAAGYEARAEESGLLDPIDEIVIDRALRRLRRWTTGRSEGPDQWIAVAVPSSRLACGAVLAQILPLLDEYSIAPSRVRLEITHLPSMRYRPAVSQTLACWRDVGGSVAIDSGALDGHPLDRRSNRIDVVKLEPCKVRAATDQGHGESYVAALIERASNAGARVIAEGVETEEQRRVLTALGCDAAQGSLIGDLDPELTEPELALYVG